MKLSLKEEIYLETKLPNIFKNTDVKIYRMCLGTKGALYKEIEYKNGSKKLFRCSDMKEVKNYEIV